MVRNKKKTQPELPPSSGILCMNVRSHAGLKDVDLTFVATKDFWNLFARPLKCIVCLANYALCKICGDIIVSDNKYVISYVWRHLSKKHKIKTSDDFMIASEPYYKCVFSPNLMSLAKRSPKFHPYMLYLHVIDRAEFIKALSLCDDNDTCDGYLSKLMLTNVCCAVCKMNFDTFPGQIMFECHIKLCLSKYAKFT